MSVLLLIVLVAPALGSLVALAARLAPAATARVSVIAAAASTVLSVAVLIAVAVDGPIEAVILDGDRAAIAGVFADRVGAVLVVLTSTVGLVVQSFASRSLLGDPRARRFHLLAGLLVTSTMLVATVATMSGLMLAWVVTSVTLVALLGHKAPWQPAVDCQRLTARSFAIGDGALVLAVLVALVAVGDLDMRVLGLGAAALDAESVASVDALGIVAVLLVIAGVARSALIPMHRWLPSTLAAPTPVSALLHAGVINGAGVLLLRFSPIYGSSVAAMALAFALGVLTAIVATGVMLVRSDVKGSLVWSTSGQMGFMVVQLGVGAFAAALFHIVGHALYKAALFLGAGGAISAHHRQTQRPHLGASDRTALTSTGARLAMGLLLPLAAVEVAMWVIDPHLTAAATILIVVFATLSIGRAANGWMAAAPFTAARTVVLSVAGVFVLAFAYIGGLSLFEGFVVDALPYDPPAAVGPVWVAVVLAVLGVAAAGIAFLPGARGDQLRAGVYGWLVSTGARTPRREAPTASSRSATEIADHRSNDLVTTGERT